MDGACLTLKSVKAVSSDASGPVTAVTAAARSVIRDSGRAGSCKGRAVRACRTAGKCSTAALTGSERLLLSRCILACKTHHFNICFVSSIGFRAI